MRFHFKLTLTLLPLFIIPWADAVTSEPYCYKNITETTYKVVTKTRIKNVSSKNFFKKITFKKDTRVEMYEEEEPVHKVKLVRDCCDGYKLNEYELCEPECVENGCPQHSTCVEPEVCECVNGYFSKRSVCHRKHFCEPICEKPCPEHSACVAPNECACQKGYHIIDNSQCKPYCASGCPHDGICVRPNECSCKEGYKSEKGSCLPICILGDQCQNGNCMAKDHCVCNQDFSWNSKTFKCEYNNMSSTTYSPYLTQLPQSTDSLMELETDIETDNDDIDPSQVFNENIETSTFYKGDEYDSSTVDALEKIHKCPDDYVFHNGECRPLKFVSNDIDCWLKPCQDKHAVCLENGTCSCIESFKLFKTHIGQHNSTNQTVEAICLPVAEYEARIQQLEQDPHKNVVKEPTNWSAIFFVVLGVLIIVSALVILFLKVLLRQRGEIDVEGKTLACTYDNRTCPDTEKTVVI